jgi:mRNA interferase RelE/StbE
LNVLLAFVADFSEDYVAQPMVPHAMNYKVELKPRAIKDLKELSVADRTRLIARLENLENNLAGDVKRLTNSTPDFRLRVGNYRILFEVNGDRVIIYRVMHRRNAYR